jgi:hypothetical protein
VLQLFQGQSEKDILFYSRLQQLVSPTGAAAAVAPRREGTGVSADKWKGNDVPRTAIRAYNINLQ